MTCAPLAAQSLADLLRVRLLMRRGFADEAHGTAGQTMLPDDGVVHQLLLLGQRRVGAALSKDQVHGNVVPRPADPVRESAGLSQVRDGTEAHVEDRSDLQLTLRWPVRIAHGAHLSSRLFVSGREIPTGVLSLRPAIGAQFSPGVDTRDCDPPSGVVPTKVLRSA